MITVTANNWQESQGGGISLIKPVNNSNSIQSVSNLYVNGTISATGTSNSIIANNVNVGSISATGAINTLSNLSVNGNISATGANSNSNFINVIANTINAAPIVNLGCNCHRLPFAITIVPKTNPYIIKLNGIGTFGPRVILELSCYGGSGSAYLYQKYTWASRFDVSGGWPPNYHSWDVNWNQGGFSSITYGSTDVSVSFVYSGNDTVLVGLFDILAGSALPMTINVTYPSS